MNDNRSIRFGRLLAIANVLGEKVLDRGEINISAKYLTDLGRKPAITLERIHADLIKHADKFGEAELVLLDMFGEITANLDLAEFTNDPLDVKYLQSYYSQQHALNSVMGVDEAGEIWGLSAVRVRALCSEGAVQAKKIGRDWVIPRNHPNPKKSADK